MQMRKIRLPILEAIEACAAVLPHCSKDEVTPVITAACITGDTITGTDRFSVGQFKLSTKLKDGSILLPHAAVAMIARLVTKHLVDYSTYAPGWADPKDGYQVVITAPEPTTAPGTKYTDEEVAERASALVTVQIVGRRGVEQQRQFRAVLGNFPVVGRLLEGFKPATEAQPVKLDPSFLEKFTGYAKKFHRGAPLRFTLSPTNSGKPGPVRIDIGRFTGLLQPNLNIDTAESR